jgi:hypothetical protein
VGALHRVDLPGLIGDEPLGFLAAVGVVGQLRDGPYLSWDPQDGHAILHCRRHTSVADVVAELEANLATIKPGQAIPRSKDFPFPRRRGQPDPLRLHPAQFRRLMDRLRRQGGGYYWLTRVVTDRSCDINGFCTVNPLVGVRGRQTVGSFWYYPMVEVRRDPRRLITQALTGWHRVEGAEGWLLDHRAAYTMDPNLRGPSGSMAVPGATWLATLAVDRFGYWRRNGVDLGRPVLPSGWFQVDDRDMFAWPLWTLPICQNTFDAVWNVGWGYDRWEFSSDGNDVVRAQITRTHGVSAPNSMDHNVDLDVFRMCGAVRSALGVLTPVTVHTIRVAGRYGIEYEDWKGWDWQYPEVPDYPGKYGWG